MREETLRLFISSRYGHLSPATQEEIFKAYLAASKRKEGALSKERGCAVNTTVSSTNYKDIRWEEGEDGGFLEI